MQPTEISTKNPIERRLWISLLILIVVSVVLWFFSGRDSRSDIKSFWLVENDPISKISIESSLGQVEMKYFDGLWRIGDTIKVNEERVALLLNALARASGRRVANGRLLDSLESKFSSDAVVVKLYSEDKVRSEFQAIGNPENNETWFRQEEGVPCQVVIPGYRTYLFSILEPRINAWKDLRVFDFNWRNFSGYQVAFPSQPLESFSVLPRDGLFGIKEISKTDTSRLNSYLDAVSLLKSDQVKTVTTKFLDSLRGVTPVARIIVREISGTAHELSLYSGGIGLKYPKDVLEFSPSKFRLLSSGRSQFIYKE